MRHVARVLVDILVIAMIWLILAPLQIWIASALTYQDQPYMIMIMQIFIPVCIVLYYGGHWIARRPTFGQEIVAVFADPVR